MNKIKLNEASDNSWLKAGKNFVGEFYGITGKERHDKFNEVLKNAIPRTSDIAECQYGIGSNYFTKGVVRIYCFSQAKNIPYNPHEMADVIEYLKNNPNGHGMKNSFSDIDNNFNYTNKKGKRVEAQSTAELYKICFGKEPNDNNLRDANLNGINISEDGKSFKVGRYTIYNTFTYETMKKYAKPSDDIENPICYVGNLGNFISDEKNYGMRSKYACIRDDYAVVEKKKYPNYPYDDFGLSFIMISIHPNGVPEICSRWNNGVPAWGGVTASKYLTKEQVEDIVLNNQYKFDDVFKPYDELTYNFRRSNQTNLRDVRGRLDAIGKRSDKSKLGLRKAEEDRMEPLVTAWLRSNGEQPYPFLQGDSQYKMAESIKLNIDDVQFILHETIKRLNIIT